VCLWLCTASVHNATQNSSDNLPSYLQTNIIAQMLSIGGDGESARMEHVDTVSFWSNVKYLQIASYRILNYQSSICHFYGCLSVFKHMHYESRQPHTSLLSSFNWVRSSNSSDDVSNIMLRVWIMCEANMTSSSAIRISEQQLYTSSAFNSRHSCLHMKVNVCTLQSSNAKNLFIRTLYKDLGCSQRC